MRFEVPWRFIEGRFRVDLGSRQGQPAETNTGSLGVFGLLSVCSLHWICSWQALETGSCYGPMVPTSVYGPLFQLSSLGLLSLDMSGILGRITIWLY